MPYYLSIDAGGSKSQAILFDENLQLLGCGRSGGVNSTQTPHNEIREHVAQCLIDVFKNTTPAYIDTVYTCFVGPVDIFWKELEKLCSVGTKVVFQESMAGMLAGRLLNHGLLAIAGTGSDVFWVTKKATPSVRRAVGGWGPILGDHGSGTWIGRMALQEAAKTAEGWGNAPILLDMLRQEWKLERDFDMVTRIHSQTAPFRFVATVTPIAARAANLGDPFCLQLFKDAGRVMARQMHTLIVGNQIPKEDRHVVCCGGAWKAHPAMFQAFCQALALEHPEISINKPWFEHVMAGPAQLLLDKGVSPTDGKQILEDRFSPLKIGW